MELKLMLGGIAAAIAVLQYVPYIRDIVKGKTKPHAFSWFVWGLPAGIVYFAQILQGAGAGSWATGVTVVLCVVIFVFSLFKGERDIKIVDWICLLISLIAVGLWIVVRDPLWSVILVTIADFAAIGPTIRKSLIKPYEETMSTYVLGTFKWIFSIAALQLYVPITVIYPVAMVLTNALFMAMIMPIRMRSKDQS